MIISVTGKAITLTFLIIFLGILLWFAIDVCKDRMKRFKIVRANYRKTLDYSVRKDYRYARMKVTDAGFNIGAVLAILIWALYHLFNTLFINQ